MARRRSGSGLRPVLLLLCAGLGAVVYAQWSAPPDRRLVDNARPPAAEPVKPLPPAKEFTPPLAEDFEEMVERPLFMQTRRPPVPAAAPAEAPPPPKETPKGDFVLVGVVISPVERLALVQQVGLTDILRVGIGRTLNGWELTEIHPDRVTFRNGETLKEVKLRDDVPPQQPQQERRRRRAPRADRERREREQEPDGDADE